jgi:putative flavoprotein involved in K+ transport
MDSKNWGTIIIGAGQAGLAAGYYLSKLDEDFIIVDEKDRIGDSWRLRWDSLLLFTPSQYDGLPGFPFPSKKDKFPSKEEMAGYLETYAGKFNLPVHLNTKVNYLSKSNHCFEISTSKGIFTSDRVVVATGTNPKPRIPEFAAEIDRSIFQIHSSQYVNPDSLPPGIVLVVGAGTSGIDIAIELSKSRKTYISGKPTFHIPDPIFRYGGRLYWWLISHLITIKTPIGRKARQSILKGGSPLIRVSAAELDKAGIERLPRVAGIKDGKPILEDGRIIPVTSIVWATGYKPDFSWIDPKVTDETGWPATKRGLSTSVENMFFIGMLFQYGLTSGLVGGVGRDAAYIGKHIHHSISTHRRLLRGSATSRRNSSKLIFTNK